MEYKPPREVTVYECRYCKCRMNTKEEHDKHYDEQHGKHGLPFCISMTFPPLEEKSNG